MDEFMDNLIKSAITAGLEQHEKQIKNVNVSAAKKTDGTESN